MYRVFKIFLTFFPLSSFSSSFPLSLIEIISISIICLRWRRNWNLRSSFSKRKYHKSVQTLSCIALPPLTLRHKYINVQNDTFFTRWDSPGVARSKRRTKKKGGGRYIGSRQPPFAGEHLKKKIEKNVIERHSVQLLPPIVHTIVHAFT